MIVLILVVIAFVVYGLLAHFFSYYLEKNRILKSRKWGLNICCGKTDGGGVNADIFKHRDLPNFQLVKDIYNLPFGDGEFQEILCSHTLEHVDDPQKFFAELKRVGKRVTIVLPPLYDIFAVLNVFEHRFIFLSFKKQHHSLPKFVKLPFAEAIQKKIGQINHA